MCFQDKRIKSSQKSECQTRQGCWSCLVEMLTLYDHVIVIQGVGTGTSPDSIRNLRHLLLCVFVEEYLMKRH